MTSPPTNTVYLSTRPARKKDAMVSPPPSTSRLSMPTSSASVSRRAGRSISSLPRRMVSSQSHSRSHPSRVTITVGALSSRIRAPSGVLPWGSSTTLTGFVS